MASPTVPMKVNHPSVSKMTKMKIRSIKGHTHISFQDESYITPVANHPFRKYDDEPPLEGSDIVAAS